MKVTPEMTIGELIRLDENIVPILMRAGMHCLLLRLLWSMGSMGIC